MWEGFRHAADLHTPPRLLLLRPRLYCRRVLPVFSDPHLHPRPPSLATIDVTID